MAIRTVYNRDGSVYGELNTDDFIFNNDAISYTPIVLDVKIYPYVKIDGVYYVNDGEAFFSKSRSGNSGSLMSVASSYLWQGKKWNELLNKIPYQITDAIGDDKLNMREEILEDVEVEETLTDKINWEWLNKIASYHTIPRYYLQNKRKNFKIISFDRNVKNNSNNEDNAGQYIFSDEIRYRGGNAKDAKYWSSYPQIYPIVLFNNTVSYDTDENGVLKVYSFVYNENNKLLSIEDYYSNQKKVIKLEDNDLVIFYERRGIWTPQSSITEWPGEWKFPNLSEDKQWGLRKYENSGDLRAFFSLSKWIPKESNVFFDADYNRWLEGPLKTESLIDNELDFFGKIINTKEINFMLPNLEGYSSPENNHFNFSIGESEDNPAIFKMEVISSRFEWINDNGIRVDPGNCGVIKNGNSFMKNFISSSDGDNVTLDVSFMQNFQSYVGCFPSQLSFFGDYDSKEKEPHLSDKYQRLIIKADDMLYYSRQWDKTLQMKVGYENSNPKDPFSSELTKPSVEKTFALAIVVWRNGKFVERKI